MRIKSDTACEVPDASYLISTQYTQYILNIIRISLYYANINVIFIIHMIVIVFSVTEDDWKPRMCGHLYVCVID